MNLTKNKLFFGIFTFGLITNLLVLFGIQHLYLRAIFSFIFLTIIPGLLIMLMLKIRKIGFWEYLVYIIGLSVAFLTFGGLFVNWTLPLVGIDKPLSLIPLLISFDVSLLIFWLIAYKRNENLSFKIRRPKLNGLSKVFFLIPMIFPVLSVLGAIILNNHGPNTLTMIMLGGIAVYAFLVVLLREKLNKNIYPWAILMISVSLLLMFSLRSWHVLPSDTSIEYQMFQLTKENFHWSMSNIRHAYNACLSVSLLPTIFSWFLKINGEYIFKLLLPLISSFVSISVFLFLRRYTKHIFAFIAAFFFMSFPFFFSNIVIHTRQGISLLFFTLTLLVLFNKSINSTLKKTLFLIFGFSMIVSHYSTTYLTLGLFIFTYLTCFVFRKTEDNKPFSRIYEKLNLRKEGRKLKERKYYLSGVLVLLLIIFSFLWLSQLTGTSDGLIDFTHKTVKNMGKIFIEEVRREGLVTSQWNVFYKPKDLTPLLQNYTKEVTLEYKNKPYINPYPSEKYRDYRPRVVYSKTVPLKTSPNIASKIYIFGEIIKKLIKVFIIIGVFYLLFFQFKKRRIDTEYIVMTLAGLFCLGAIIILPFASISYELGRTCQQILVILSLPSVLGGLIMFKFSKKNIRIILILVIFIFYFLFLSGFIPQIVGGSEAPLQLNNFGANYNKFYTHNSEVESAQWLSANYNKRNSVYSDKRVENILDAFAKDLDFSTYGGIVLPSIINKNAYVYISYSNKIKNIGFIRTKATSISYNFPTNFLNQNKNKIYNNGGSEIFK